MFKKYFSNTSWLMAERIFAIVLTLAVGIYVARYLGPAQFGNLNYAISFVGLFSTLATLGLDQIVVRELVTSPGQTDRLLSTVFWLKIAGAVLVLVLALLTLVVSSSDPHSIKIVVIVASGLFFQSFNVIDFFFQSRVLSKFSVLAQMIQLSISSLLRVALVLLHAQLFWFALVIALESLVLAAGLLYFFRAQQKNKFPFFNFNTTLARQMLKESWPLMLSGIVVSIYMKIDQVMIKEMLSNEAVGVYAVAVRLSEPWYFIPVIALKSLFPAIIALRQGDQRKYEVRLQQLHDLLSFIAFGIAFFVFCFSDVLVAFLYGDLYLGAGPLLAIHIWSCLLVFPGNIRAHLIIIEKRQVPALIFRALGAVLNICLNYILIPRVGVMGAAWATLASFFFPVLVVAVFDSVIRQTVIMTFKSYCLPIRALIYRASLYQIPSGN